VNLKITFEKMKGIRCLVIEISVDFSSSIPQLSLKSMQQKFVNDIIRILRGIGHCEVLSKEGESFILVEKAKYREMLEKGSTSVSPSKNAQESQNSTSDENVYDHTDDWEFGKAA
jgi:hypothetical protein